MKDFLETAMLVFQNDSLRKQTSPVLLFVSDQDVIIIMGSKACELYVHTRYESLCPAVM